MWSSWPQFLAMGGYGLYVWGSLAMCVLVVAIELLQLTWRGKTPADVNLDHPGDSGT